MRRERSRGSGRRAARLGLPIYESAFMGGGAPAGAPVEHTAVCFCQGGSAPLAQLLGPRGPLALRVQRLTLTFFFYFFWVLRQNATAQFSLPHNQSSASALASQMFSHGGKINQLAGTARGGGEEEPARRHAIVNFNCPWKCLPARPPVSYFPWVLLFPCRMALLLRVEGLGTFLSLLFQP